VATVQPSRFVRGRGVPAVVFVDKLDALLLQKDEEVVDLGGFDLIRQVGVHLVAGHEPLLSPQADKETKGLSDISPSAIGHGFPRPVASVCLC
jgi:hypothetical protein